MKNLNELVKQYKQKKSPEILNRIFELLEKTIIDKSKYIFYEQRFFANENLKLCNTKKIELEDVKQELRLDIIEWVNKCKSVLPFDKYLFSNLWNWRPKIVREILSEPEIQSIYQINSKGEEENIAERFLVIEQEIEESEPINYDKMFGNLTIIEKLIINILKKNPQATQQQIADMIGVTHQRIDQYFKKIRKKYIKPLQN